MIKIKLIRGIINISSLIQTYLINYLEFHKFDPRESAERGYALLAHPPEQPEEIPKPFQKEDVIKPHYTILLKLAEEQGQTINPIVRNRKESLRTGEKYCRKCKAPPEYLRNHGFYRRKSTGEIFPKHTCKVCFAEYAPQATRKKSKHVCPYCGYAMNPKNYRKNFTVYFCKQKTCSHMKLHPQGKRYSEREWHFDYDKLETEQIHSPKLEKMRLSKQMLDLEMSLFVECGVTARETKKILQKLYGEVAVKSPQTVINHANALAGFIKANEGFLPIILGKEVCEDETYLKYSGKWGYLFRALNPENRAIVAEHFSQYRDTKGCITLNKAVTNAYLKQCKDPEFALISDQAPIYTAMKSYFDEKNLARIDHKPVKGIFNELDEENGEWRSQKQTIERSFESLKSATKRRRGFSSFKGAQIFCYLNKIYYNHLRPHSGLENMPPMPLFMKNGRKVTNWHELLQYLSEKRR